MSQPVALGQWTAVSGGAGTTVLTDRSDAQLIRIVIPGTYTGTINFHDAATAAGTTSTSQILSLGIPATNIAGAIEVGVRCRNGLLYQATGTPIVTIVWD